MNRVVNTIEVLRKILLKEKTS
uniref:Uncharacterized protein n=1 Tax=Anguilla anguilla TaxID=7936 RepID=A0A0E9XZP1_ANGAN